MSLYFCGTVFSGNFEEVIDYIKTNYKESHWDCPTGREDLEGMISVFNSGGDNEELEVDGLGNIKFAGDPEIFAFIEEED